MQLYKLAITGSLHLSLDQFSKQSKKGLVIVQKPTDQKIKK